MNRFLYALAGVVLLAASVGALSIDSSTAQMSLVAGRTSGELTLWFENSDGSPVEYAVSVDAGELDSRVSPAYGFVEPRSAKSFTLLVSAPACSRGVFYTNVNLELHYLDGRVERASRVIEVNVARGIGCDVELTGLPSNNGFDSAPSIGFSGISRPVSFDPTELRVVLDAPVGISDLANGEFRQVKLTLYNRGGAATYQLALVADPMLDARLSQAGLAMQRSEVASFYLNLRPQAPLTGRKWIEVQVLHQGVVVSQRSVYVDVASNYAGSLVLPQVVKTDNCGAKVIAGAVENKGSSVDNFSVSVPLLGLSTGVVSVPAHSTVPFVVTADLSNARSERRAMEFELHSAKARGVVSTTSVEFDVSPCAVGLLNYSLTLTNPTNSTYRGVVASVEGLPVDWEVVSELPVDIEPGENHTFTVLVRQKSEVEQELRPVLVVRDADGNVLKTENLSAIKPSRLSGLFTFAGVSLSNLQMIAVLLFVALIVAVFSTRATVKRYESI